MSKDLVIVPTYQRPELLRVCLEHIFACPEAPRLDVRVVADQHIGKVTPLELIHQAIAGFDVRLDARLPHRWPGNSYNVLTAYKEALLGDSEFVFLVEDDVLVAPEFFLWHYQAQRAAEPFCSIALENPRHSERRLEGFHLACDYASLGVCFRRERLAPIMVHTVPEYFGDQLGYVRRHFNAGDYFSEQDGLIRRLMQRENLLAAWACEPHARHVGWYGYHRPGPRPLGPLERRVEKVRAQLATIGHLL